MTSEAIASLGPDSIVGSYRIVKEIGRGGMATVYEAVHTVLPRRAAIKVMHADLRRQPGMATRMVQEAAILEDVRHGGIVRVYECNLLPDHRPWIAMELVEGETLASRLQYPHAPHHPHALHPHALHPHALHPHALPTSDVAKLVAEVADVLAAVHARGIVHRDLKPDNLLLTPADHYFPLRVIDWGVARLGPMGRLTLDGLTPGTPIYMSPEQATGKNIAAPCDVYSLGVIAYEALTGHPPFDGRTLAEVVCMHMTGEPAPLHERCGAPRELCDLVHRMLDKDPAMRPGAIEVRQLARAIAMDLTSAYAEFELTRHEPEPTRGRTPALQLALADLPVPTDEAVVVDPDALEYGITEMLPVVRKPRWTPQIGQAIPGAVVASQGDGTSGGSPRAGRDPGAGELHLVAKRRD